MTLSPERIAQIANLLDAPRGLTTDAERDLLVAGRDLLAELRRRTPGQKTCPEHPDQPASRCRTCAAEAVPPPENWRNRA